MFEGKEKKLKSTFLFYQYIKTQYIYTVHVLCCYIGNTFHCVNLEQEEKIIIINLIKKNHLHLFYTVACSSISQFFFGSTALFLVFQKNYTFC